MKPVVILGAGGHGKVVSDTIRASGATVAGYLDASLPKDTLVNGAPVLGDDNYLADLSFVTAHSFAIGVANQIRKRALAEQVLHNGFELITAVHPAAIVSASATIRPGTIVVAGAIVNADALVGGFSILNTACSVDHDCVLADGCQISPGAHLAGNVRCGSDVFIGIGAAIAPGITIGDRAVIGAGATVLHDVAPNQTVVGTPARPLRTTGQSNLGPANALEPGQIGRIRSTPIGQIGRIRSTPIGQLTERDRNRAVGNARADGCDDRSGGPTQCAFRRLFDIDDVRPAVSGGSRFIESSCADQ